MALTAIDYEVFSALHGARVLPVSPAVLEIGESEWYGDVSPDALDRAIERFVTDADRRQRLHERLAHAVADSSPHASWSIAKLFYDIFLGYRRIAAIDLHGTPAALQLDLNRPVALGEQFEVVINSGTAEHVFDVGQFFRNCHAFTRPGGLMIHHAPFIGWVDHGFYSFHPTFFWDLAHANRYEMLFLACTDIAPLRVQPLRSREELATLARAGSLGSSAMLFAALRKPSSEAEFRAPMQGVYAGSVSEAVMEAWHTMR